MLRAARPAAARVLALACSRLAQPQVLGVAALRLLHTARVLAAASGAQTHSALPSSMPPFLMGNQAALQQPVRMVVPTVLRPGKGRPRRLAPDAVPADSSSPGMAAAGSGGSGLASSTAASLVAAQPRRSAPAALPAFKSTATVPRSLTSPLPPLAEVPSWLLDVSKRVALATIRGSATAVRWTASAIASAIRDPAAAKANAAELWQMIKEEAHHYWVGSKLLVAEVRTSSTLLRRVGRGETLTRRERLQLKRTVSA